MNWLLVAITAHFINSIVFVIDKYILSKTPLKPAAYAFYVGLLGGLMVLILIPFGFNLIPLSQILISFLSGALFVFAVLNFYKSIQFGEVSKVAPVVGGAIPVFTLFLTYFFLGERLSFEQLIAFAVLVLGGAIIVWPRGKHTSSSQIDSLLTKRLPRALLAAFFFAASFVTTKYIFSLQPFISGFIWIRLGGILGAGIIFLLPGVRQTIFKSSRRVEVKTGLLAFLSKSLSIGGFVLLNYAIFLGSVSLVNALQGVQYVFLLILGIFLSRKFPQIVREQISQGVIIQKVIAIVLISIGLVILIL